MRTNFRTTAFGLLAATSLSLGFAGVSAPAAAAPTLSDLALLTGGPDAGVQLIAHGAGEFHGGGHGGFRGGFRGGFHGGFGGRRAFAGGYHGYRHGYGGWGGGWGPYYGGYAYCNPLFPIFNPLYCL